MLSFWLKRSCGKFGDKWENSLLVGSNLIQFLPSDTLETALPSQFNCMPRLKSVKKPGPESLCVWLLPGQVIHTSL